MFTPVVGLGVSLEGRAHEGTPTISARVPHPFTFNAFGTDTREGDTALSRQEASVNIQVMLDATPNSERFRFRVFAGPSFYRVEQEAVSDVIFMQLAPILTRINEITITNYEFEKIDGTGWGFHAGVDASFYFSRVFGLGGMVKFSRANVTLEDVVGEYDSKAGGVAFAGGLRFKF